MLATDVGSWVETKVEYTTIFPAAYEPNPSLVKRIREVCPNFVVLLANKTYTSPANTEEVASYYMLGTWQDVRTDDVVEPANVTRGTDFPFKGGYIFAQRPWCLAWPVDSVGYKIGMPPPALPFDEGVLLFVKGMYQRAGVPFGTKLQGTLRGNKLQEAEDADRKVEENKLKSIRENAKYENRDSKKLYERAVDAFRTSEKAFIDEIIVEKEPKPFRDQIKTSEPPSV